jgi:hypothetical protein
MTLSTYNRKLNEKPRILKFFTPWEFFFLVILIGIPPALTQIFGLKPSFIESGVIAISYTLFVIYFKLGKPEGYLYHLIISFFTPKHFRPGHRTLRDFPIAFPKAAVPTRADLAQTEKMLWDIGFVPIEPGRFIPRAEIAGTPLEQEAQENILKGQPISL